MRREERVTVEGPVKEQQPDGMSHRGGGGLCQETRSGLSHPHASVPLHTPVEHMPKYLLHP